LLIVLNTSRSYRA